MVEPPEIHRPVIKDKQSRISPDAPAAFFALTFALAAPFYILNALAHLELLGGPGLGPVYIALFTVTPLLSASLLRLRQGGTKSVKQLLWRILDAGRIKDYRWFAVIVLLPLLFASLSLAGAYLSGVALPQAMVPITALPVLLPFLFVLAAMEEAGWMGHAFEPMQERCGALRAALVLGVLWAIWHVPFFVFMMPDVIAFQLVTLVGTRVLIAWVYNNAGRSVFAATLFHAAGNVLLVTLPNTSQAGLLGPAISCVLVLSAAVVVTLLWGPRTLARFRFVR